MIEMIISVSCRQMGLEDYVADEAQDPSLVSLGYQRLEQARSSTAHAIVSTRISVGTVRRSHQHIRKPATVIVGPLMGEWDRLRRLRNCKM